MTATRGWSAEEEVLCPASLLRGNCGAGEAGDGGTMADTVDGDATALSRSSPLETRTEEYEGGSGD